MVSTSSAATQANESEKRRKQTMEKVKANHLSRQLQMRLQYARLKVEHGWQKQNLNEVENLYFHNSHLRGAKPFPAPSIVTTQRQHSSYMGPSANAMQSSSLSFKLASSSLARNSLNSTISTNDQSTNAAERNDINPIHATQTTHIQYNLSATSTDPSLRSDLSNDTSEMLAEVEERRPSVVSAGSDPVVSSTSPEDSNMNGGEHLVPTTSLSPQSQDKESLTDPSVLSSSNPNHYPSVKPPRPRAQKIPVGSKSTQSLTAKDMYNFGMASTLTYDSFWSSHSGSTTPRPGPSRGPGGTEYTPTFQIPGDFTSGIEASRPQAYSPSPSLQTPQ